MYIKVSIGEFLDKISILLVKIDELEDSVKIKHCQNELIQLKSLVKEEFIPYLDRLISVNKELFKVLQKQHEIIQKADFGEDFIKEARNVYELNYKRFKIKEEINKIFESEIVEEKSY